MYALQTATNDLSSAATELTSAINAVNPPPSKIASSIPAATLSNDTDLASRATTAAKQDAALASNDGNNVFNMATPIFALAYC